MIKITIKKKDSIIYGFTSSGHAEYAKSGKDIICAGVSAIVINTINSVEKFTNDQFKLDEQQEMGKIIFDFIQSPSEKSQLLMDSMVLGLQGIQQNYGKKYIILNFKEV